MPIAQLSPKPKMTFSKKPAAGFTPKPNYPNQPVPFKDILKVAGKKGSKA